MPLVALIEQLRRRIKSELDVTARELAPDLRPSHVRLLSLTPGRRQSARRPRQQGRHDRAIARRIRRHAQPGRLMPTSSPIRLTAGPGLSGPPRAAPRSGRP